jgi:hypothetical protein
MTLWVSQGVTRPAVTTDARGEAPALVPQRKKFYVYLLSREWVLQSGDAGEWVEGIGGDACELRAMRRALVTGRVVDAAGKPVPGTVIAIERDDNELDGTRCHATGDGTFSTWLSASSRTGLVLSAHGARGQVRRELPPAGPDGSTRVELALDPPNIATGIIVDGDGKPIAGARLQVSGDRDRSYRTLVSERDGSFALVGHDAVPYVFDVEGAKFERPLGSGVTVLAPLVIDR